jgi:hypothetical protein
MGHGQVMIPTGLLRTQLQKRLGHRVGARPAVFLSACLVDVMGRLLSGAASQAKVARRVRILPQDIQAAVRDDNDLMVVFHHTVMRLATIPRRRRSKKVRNQASKQASSVGHSGSGAPKTAVVIQPPPSAAPYYGSLDDMQVSWLNDGIARTAAKLGVPLEVASHPGVGVYPPLPPGAWGYSLQLVHAPPDHWIVIFIPPPYTDVYVIDTFPKLHVRAHTRQVPIATHVSVVSMVYANAQPPPSLSGR